MRRAARNDSAALDDITWSADEASQMHDGDWLICVNNNRRVLAPAKTLKVSPTTKHEVVCLHSLDSCKVGVEGAIANCVAELTTRENTLH